MLAPEVCPTSNTTEIVALVVGAIGLYGSQMFNSWLSHKQGADSVNGTVHSLIEKIPAANSTPTFITTAAPAIPPTVPADSVAVK